MEARVAVLEAANAKTQLLLEAIHHLLEEKFASIDRCLDSIESRHESSDQICTHPSEEDDGDGDRRRGVMPEKKIKMVSFHLDREALQWFQWEDCVSSCSKWEDFTKAFCREFGPHEFEDFAEALFKLRQTGPLKEYIAEFRRLATRIHDLSPTLQLSCFIGGLREGLKQDVKLLCPATVHEAMNFAHEVDAKFQKLRFAHPSINSSPKLPLQHNVALTRTRTESTSQKDMPFKKLTPEEIQYKRQNNLCFYCDEKFVRGHKCARKQILLLDMGYNSSEEEEIAHKIATN
ncbi:hypothetical protein SADUNF_Sadunf12G0040800 [Salix dunnii]|uniref:Retrotransposon gag domain-containing protein n=1 Tax=Salix dunnii TaxID=1413687 RepID=A0A835MMU3_9ROSI|nr:hypothetical protein SADUNF_Sadunf12G0040800 [Salix dunnii]